jgi:hypothetical protein
MSSDISESLSNLLTKVRPPETLTLKQSVFDVVFGSIKLILLVGPIISILFTSTDLNIQLTLFLLYILTFSNALGYLFVQTYYGPVADILITILTILKTLEVLPLDNNEIYDEYHVSSWGVKYYAWIIVFGAQVIFSGLSIPGVFFEDFSNHEKRSYHSTEHVSFNKYGYYGIGILILIGELLRTLIAMFVLDTAYVIKAIIIPVGLGFFLTLSITQTKNKTNSLDKSDPCNNGIIVLYSLMHLVSILSMGKTMAYITGGYAIILLFYNDTALTRTEKEQLHSDREAIRKSGLVNVDDVTMKNYDRFRRYFLENKFRFLHLMIILFGIILFTVFVDYRGIGLLIMIFGSVSFAFYDEDETYLEDIWIRLITSKTVWSLIFISSILFLLAADINEPYYHTTVTFPSSVQTVGCTITDSINTYVEPFYNITSDPRYMQPVPPATQPVFYPILFQLKAVRIGGSVFISSVYPVADAACNGVHSDFIPSGDPLTLITFFMLAVLLIIMCTQTYKYGYEFVSNDVFWSGCFLIILVHIFVTQLLGDIITRAYNIVIKDSTYSREYTSWGIYATSIQCCLLLSATIQMLLPKYLNDVTKSASKQIDARNRHHWLKSLTQFVFSPGILIQIFAILVFLVAASKGSPIDSLKLKDSSSSTVPLWARLNIQSYAPSVDTNQSPNDILRSLITDAMFGNIYYVIDVLITKLPALLSSAFNPCAGFGFGVGSVCLNDLVGSVTDELTSAISPILHTIGDTIGVEAANVILAIAEGPLLQSVQGLISLLDHLNFDIFDFSLNLSPDLGFGILSSPMWILSGLLLLEFLSLRFVLLQQIRTMTIMILFNIVGAFAIGWVLVDLALDKLGYSLSVTVTDTFYIYLFGIALVIFGMTLLGGYFSLDQRTNTFEKEDLRVIMSLQIDDRMGELNLEYDNKLKEIRAEKETEIRLFIDSAAKQKSTRHDAEERNKQIELQIREMHEKREKALEEEKRLMQEQVQQDILKKRAEYTEILSRERKKLDSEQDVNLRQVKKQELEEEAKYQLMKKNLEEKTTEHKKEIEGLLKKQEQLKEERKKIFEDTEHKTMEASIAKKEFDDLMKLRKQQEEEKRLEQKKVDDLEKARSERMKQQELEAKQHQEEIRKKAELEAKEQKKKDGAEKKKKDDEVKQKSAEQKKRDDESKQKIIDQKKKDDAEQKQKLLDQKRKDEEAKQKLIDQKRKEEIEHKKKEEVEFKQKLLDQKKKEEAAVIDAKRITEKQQNNTKPLPHPIHKSSDPLLLKLSGQSKARARFGDTTDDSD